MGTQTNALLHSKLHERAVPNSSQAAWVAPMLWTSGLSSQRIFVLQLQMTMPNTTLHYTIIPFLACETIRGDCNFSDQSAENTSWCPVHDFWQTTCKIYKFRSATVVAQKVDGKTTRSFHFSCGQVESHWLRERRKECKLLLGPPLGCPLFRQNSTRAQCQPKTQRTAWVLFMCSTMPRGTQSVAAQYSETH